MQQSVRLSKIRKRRVRKQATKEEIKKLRKQQESNSSPEGKIMIGSTEQVNPQVQRNNLFCEQNKKMKLQITKQDERCSIKESQFEIL